MDFIVSFKWDSGKRDSYCMANSKLNYSEWPKVVNKSIVGSFYLQFFDENLIKVNTLVQLMAAKL